MYDYDGNGVLDKNDFEVLLVCNIDFDIPVLDDNMFEEKKHIIINVELMCQIYFFLILKRFTFQCLAVRNTIMEGKGTWNQDK